MFFLYLFFQSVFAASSLASGTELSPNCPDPTWLMLHSRLHYLKMSLKSLPPEKFYNRLFLEDLRNFQIESREFFSKDPLSAFDILEEHSNDIGTTFFFFNIVYDDRFTLSPRSNVLLCFLDEEFLKIGIRSFLLDRVKTAIAYVNSKKETAGLLAIAIRIFERIRERIFNYCDLTLLDNAIKGWKYEIFKYDNMKQLDHSLNDELLDYFYQIKHLIQSGKNLDFLRDYLIYRFDKLAVKFFLSISPARLSFLLAQRIEFTMILFNCSLFCRGIVTFEIFFIFFGNSVDLNGQNKVRIAYKAKSELSDFIHSCLTAVPNGSPFLHLGHETFIKEGREEEVKLMSGILKKIESYIKSFEPKAKIIVP